MARRLLVPLVCAVIGLIVAWVAVQSALDAVDGRLSVLVRMAADEPMATVARSVDPTFAFVPSSGHYDGVYVYAIALDPIAQGEQHALLTQPAYRYRNPMYGWMSAAASLGQASWLPTVMLLINVAAFALATILVSLLAASLGRTPWLGLLVALNPGFIIALTVDTAEPIAMALIAAGVLAWLSERRWLAAVALTAAAFTREIGVAVAVGMIVYEVVAWWRARTGGPPLRALVRRLLPLAVAPLAYAAWWGYLWARLGTWPTFEPSNLTIPVAGIFDTLTRATRMTVATEFEIQLGIPIIALLTTATMTLVLALLHALRLRTVLDGIAIPVALLVLSLNWLPTLYPKELLRNGAIAVVLLTLAVVVSAARTAVPVRARATRLPAD